MSTTINGPFGTLRIEREIMLIGAGFPEDDRAWRHADAHGHEHRWEDGDDRWPTLRWVVDAPGGDGYPDEGHWECRECGDHVEPGIRIRTHDRRVPVSTDYYLNDEPITENDARALLASVSQETR